MGEGARLAPLPVAVQDGIIVAVARHGTIDR